MTADRHAPVTCPGCGAVQLGQGLTPPGRYHASGECWATYGELSAALAERAELSFPTQLSVDAYGAQHAGGSSRPITTAFSLIGLYLVNERGQSGRQAQLAHMRLARQRWTWPAFVPPDMQGSLTVLDVLAAPSGPPQDQQLRAWSASVWAAWQDWHGWTADFCRRHLG
ncbi:DUF5946 family protein [Deinococcus sonorensis]|uniref:DUF5946 family protein n=2 Tax=Deinococcus sonorensis TaxID=309891 RepID=A0AAU7UEA1_9DEIO